jgi:hypothetical protein
MIEIPSNVIFDEFASLIFYRFQWQHNWVWTVMILSWRNRIEKI